MPNPKPLGLKELDYSILQQCMHCGMCLPSCPTYDATGRERHSPRGRIALMRAIADDQQALNDTFAEEMYYCLGCMACQSACPAGVDYASLLETARADIEEHHILDTEERNFWRWLTIKFLFMRPRWLRAAARLLWIYQKTKLDTLVRRCGLLRLLPRRLRELEGQTPRIRDRFTHQLTPPLAIPADGQTRYRVGMLSGCVHDIALSEINKDTVDVLLANGCQVFTPPLQSCCGSLHGHNGERELARVLARRTIDAFDLDQLDAVISNAGGCGSHLKTYGELLSDDPNYAEKARQWDRKLKDVHEWLAEIELTPPPPLREPLQATYHASCHLCHAQGIKQQPKALLALIPGLTLVPLSEEQWCCGSAGIYNITQPEQAKRLQDRKAERIRATGCSTVATANPGCHFQLQNALGEAVATQHPISLLAQAYRGK